MCFKFVKSFFLCYFFYVLHQALTFSKNKADSEKKIHSSIAPACLKLVERLENKAETKWKKNLKRVTVQMEVRESTFLTKCWAEMVLTFFENEWYSLVWTAWWNFQEQFRAGWELSILSWMVLLRPLRLLQRLGEPLSILLQPWRGSTLSKASRSKRRDLPKLGLFLKNLVLFCRNDQK